MAGGSCDCYLHSLTPWCLEGGGVSPAVPSKTVKDVLGYVTMRGMDQKRLVNTAGGLKAYMHLQPVLCAGVLFFVRKGFVAGCG